MGPSPEDVDALVILVGAEQVGFVLEKRTFLDAVRSHAPVLCPALVNAACVWGARLSRDKTVADHEPAFLSRAVQGVAESLAHASECPITHVVQAEVLLAAYFYAMGRTVEGRYHTSAAIALSQVLQANLTTRPPNNTAPRRRPSGGIYIPTDDEESLHVICSVFILDKTWSAGCGCDSASHLGPSPFNDRAVSRSSPQSQASNGDIDSLPSWMPALEQHSAHCCLGNRCSFLIAHAKAAGLYERASRMSQSITYRSDDRAALALESNIISLLSSVPSLEPDLRREDDSSILSIRTLAYTAMIQLQQDSHQQQSFTGQKAFMAAMDAAALLPMDDRLLQEAPFFDPILSILWGDVVEVLGSASRRRERPEESRLAQDALRRVQRGMTTASRITPNMALQLARSQHTYATSVFRLAPQ